GSSAPPRCAPRWTGGSGGCAGAPAAPASDAAPRNRRTSQAPAEPACLASPRGTRSPRKHPRNPRATQAPAEPARHASTRGRGSGDVVGKSQGDPRGGSACPLGSHIFGPHSQPWVSKAQVALEPVPGSSGEGAVRRAELRAAGSGAVGTVAIRATRTAPRTGAPTAIVPSRRALLPSHAALRA